MPRGVVYLEGKQTDTPGYVVAPGLGELKGSFMPLLSALNEATGRPVLFVPAVMQGYWLRRRFKFPRAIAQQGVRIAVLTYEYRMQGSVLLGHSAGGPAALWAAACYADAYSAIGLLTSSCWAAEPFGQLLGRLIAETKHDLYDAKHHTNHVIRAACKAQLWDTAKFGLLNPWRAIRIGLAQANFSIAPLAQSLNTTVPVHALYTGADILYPIWAVEAAICSSLPAEQITFLPNLPHDVQQRPAEVLKVLDGWGLLKQYNQN